MSLLLFISRQDLNTILSVVGIVAAPSLALIVWLIQRRINRKERERLQGKAELAEAKAREALTEKESIAKGHKELVERVDTLTREAKEEKEQGRVDSQTLALLKQEMLPMAEAMKRKLVDILTHPSDGFEAPDALLKKVLPAGACLPEELVPILEERAHSTNPHVTEQEKLAATALPIIVRLAELEAKEISGDVTSMQLVTSTAKSTATKKQEENSE